MYVPTYLEFVCTKYSVLRIGGSIVELACALRDQVINHWRLTLAGHKNL
jgi:hypothetical protein